MADYPDAITSLTNPASTDRENNPSHSEQHINANDEIEAIEGELGVDPAGSSDTVVARLDTNDTAVGLNTTHAADNDQAHSDYFKNSTDSFSGTATFNDASNATLINVDNGGTGHGLHILQSGVLAESKYGLYIYSNNEQVEVSRLAYIKQDNLVSTADAMLIENDGTGRSLYLSQVGKLATERNTLYISSPGSQTNTDSALMKIIGRGETSSEPVVEIIQEHASATSTGLELRNDGTGNGLLVDSNGIAAPGVVIDQASNGTHLRFTGDPTVASPVDGDMWFDGTNLRIQIGTGTFLVNLTEE